MAKRASTHRSPARFIARTLPGAKPAPFPGFVEPCHPTLKKHVPSGERWVHEIKHDGYRVQGHLIGGVPKLITRRGHDWTHRMSAIAEALAEIPANNLVVDGELIVPDAEGRGGFVLPQREKAPRRVTNSRDDKVQSSFWRDSVPLRRCLVTASSFCEPNGEVKPTTTWHWFVLADPDEPRPLFAFAGILRRTSKPDQEEGPIKKDGSSVSLDVFSFMTTTPNALVATVNHERMPVLLASEDDHEAWLNGSVEVAWSLVKPFPADRSRQAGPPPFIMSC